MNVEVVEACVHVQEGGSWGTKLLATLGAKFISLLVATLQVSSIRDIRWRQQAVCAKEFRITNFNRFVETSTLG